MSDERAPLPYDGLASLTRSKVGREAAALMDEQPPEPARRDLRAEVDAKRQATTSTEAAEDGAGAAETADTGPSLTDEAAALLSAQDAPTASVHRGGGNYYTWSTDEGHEFHGHTRGKDRLPPDGVLLDADAATPLLDALDAWGG